MAVAKFCQTLLLVIVILALMPIMGLSWHSAYLKLGRIGVWLPIGLAALIVFPVLAFLLLSSREGVLEKLLPLWPSLLLFVLSNGCNEELLFRGLSLQRYEGFLGKGLANILTAIVFTLMHIQVAYAPQMLQFLTTFLGLSLIWGIQTQKTDSLWGPSSSTPLLTACSSCPHLPACSRRTQRRYLPLNRESFGRVTASEAQRSPMISRGRLRLRIVPAPQP
jgi:signal transduction histidine kinase